MMALEEAWGSGAPREAEGRGGESSQTLSSMFMLLLSIGEWDSTAAYCFGNTTSAKTHNRHGLTSPSVQKDSGGGLWNICLHVGLDSASMIFDNWYAVSMLLRHRSQVLRGSAGRDAVVEGSGWNGVFIIL